MKMINCGSQGVDIEQIEFWRLTKRNEAGVIVFARVSDPGVELLLWFKSGEKIIIESKEDVSSIINAIWDLDASGTVNW